MGAEKPVYPDYKMWNKIEKLAEKKRLSRAITVRPVGRFTSNGHEFIWTVGHRNDRRHGVITPIKPNPYIKELYNAMFSGWRK